MAKKNIKVKEHDQLPEFYKNVEELMDHLRKAHLTYKSINSIVTHYEPIKENKQEEELISELKTFNKDLRRKFVSLAGYSKEIRNKVQDVDKFFREKYGGEEIIPEIKEQTLEETIQGKETEIIYENILSLHHYINRSFKVSGSIEGIQKQYNEKAENEEEKEMLENLSVYRDQLKTELKKLATFCALLKKSVQNTEDYFTEKFEYKYSKHPDAVRIIVYKEDLQRKYSTTTPQNVRFTSRDVSHDDDDNLVISFDNVKESLEKPVGSEKRQYEELEDLDIHIKYDSASIEKEEEFNPVNLGLFFEDIRKGTIYYYSNKKKIYGPVLSVKDQKRGIITGNQLLEQLKPFRRNFFYPQLNEYFAKKFNKEMVYMQWYEFIQTDEFQEWLNKNQHGLPTLKFENSQIVEYYESVVKFDSQKVLHDKANLDNLSDPTVSLKVLEFFNEKEKYNLIKEKINDETRFETLEFYMLDLSGFSLRLDQSEKEKDYYSKVEAWDDIRKNISNTFKEFPEFFTLLKEKHPEIEDYNRTYIPSWDKKKQIIESESKRVKSIISHFLDYYQNKDKFFTVAKSIDLTKFEALKIYMKKLSKIQEKISYYEKEKVSESKLKLREETSEELQNLRTDVPEFYKIILKENPSLDEEIFNLRLDPFRDKNQKEKE